MDPKKLIDLIILSCKKSIAPEFNLKLLKGGGYNILHYVVEGASDAVNNNQESVKVLKWFDNFWLFLEIRFRLLQNKNIRKDEIYISLSVFHGNDLDCKKRQLFRAEWDDYGSLDEKTHAQPHWHVSSNQETEKTFNKNFDDDFEDFSQTKSEKQNIVDVSKIHFAMVGDWQNTGKHAHMMESEEQIVKWLQGMLNHLRSELKNL